MWICERYYFFCFVSLSCFANQDSKFLHLSPEIKAGPQYGTGITGWGMQLGLADVYQTNSLYFNGGQVNYDFLTDTDEWKFYRLGVEHRLVKEEKISFQFELGVIDYEGERRFFTRKETREGVGFSSAGAVVFNFNGSLGIRFGLDVNVLDKDKTYQTSSTFINVNSGVVFRF
ncbi:hypothetical protein JCM19232_981 [Vibrio ishigakensis]|uniref:Outer membrane protein beta-barrel domain-containing protein n=1 Tax=Vibrio ishigakensis TaxID=1481914 RepID=A0A0B8PD93_9VIBR|nr:hypothetical protein JCM19232_981 [Vibrio ishigakensis]